MVLLSTEGTGPGGYRPPAAEQDCKRRWPSGSGGILDAEQGNGGGEGATGPTDWEGVAEGRSYQLDLGLRVRSRWPDRSDEGGKESSSREESREGSHRRVVRVGVASVGNEPARVCVGYICLILLVGPGLHWLLGFFSLARGQCELKFKLTMYKG